MAQWILDNKIINMIFSSWYFVISWGDSNVTDRVLLANIIDFVLKILIISGDMYKIQDTSLRNIRNDSLSGQSLNYRRMQYVCSIPK